jgi:hypothetical protein
MHVWALINAVAGMNVPGIRHARRSPYLAIHVHISQPQRIEEVDGIIGDVAVEIDPPIFGDGISG